MSVTSKTIIVGGIESKDGMGKNGKPYTRYSVKDQGDKFVGSTFSDTIAGVLRANIAKQVTLEIEERENPNGPNPFRDIVGAMPGVIPNAAAIASVQGGPRSEIGTQTSDITIRVTALTAAIGSGAPLDQILGLADKYVSWLGEASQVQHLKAFDPDEVPF
jgi:hypothetical protein